MYQPVSTPTLAMRYVKSKDANRIVVDLVREGWTFSYSGTTHGRVTHPSGRFVTFSTSPGDHNAHRQFWRDVRRLKQQIESPTP